jgi:AraC family transcriptional regulator, melibiose operon regulatory protein
MAEVDTFGLRVWSGEVVMMSEPHRHHELELNLVFNGSMSYLFGGQRLTLETGQLMLFWGTLPHRLLDCQQGTVCGWLTLPLATFLRYGLPEKLTQRVLHGEPVLQTVREVDKVLFEQWVEDWQRPTAEKQEVLELELGAWLRRLSLTLKTESRTIVKQRSDLKLQDSKAAQLAEFMSEHYQEPLQIRDVANVVGLNESYASTLFKETFSMTMLEYLTQHRVAHAQRLLVTTNKSVLEIAFDAGFGSSSQFYAAFVKSCGQTPLAYRKRVRS